MIWKHPRILFSVLKYTQLKILSTQKWSVEKNNDVYKPPFFLTGVYKEAFSNVILKEDFFEELSKEDKEDWKDKHGEDVMSYFNQSLITKIGRPALKMLRFVPHCLFSLVSFCFVLQGIFI